VTVILTEWGGTCHVCHFTDLKVFIAPIGIFIYCLFLGVYMPIESVFVLVPCATFADLKVVFYDKILSLNKLHKKSRA
jgi:hypothetical protein